MSILYQMTYILKTILLLINSFILSLSNYLATIYAISTMLISVDKVVNKDI